MFQLATTCVLIIKFMNIEVSPNISNSLMEILFCRLMRRLPVEYPDFLEEHKEFSIRLGSRSWLGSSLSIKTLTFCAWSSCLWLLECSLGKQLADLLSKHTNDDRQALQIFKDTLAYDDKNTEVKLYKKKIFFPIYFSLHWKLLQFILMKNLQTYLQMAKLEMKNQNFDLAHSYCTNILN